MDQDKRVRILQAAKERFDRFGFKKTTVDEIAQYVGMSKRTLYEMFASKEKILGEVIITEATIFSNYLAERLAEIKDPRDRLVTLIEQSREYFERNPYLGKVLSDDEGAYAPFLENEIEFVETGIARMIASILRKGGQQGVFRTMDDQAAANCILVLFRHFIYGAGAKNGEQNREWISFALHALTTK